MPVVFQNPLFPITSPRTFRGRRGLWYPRIECTFPLDKHSVVSPLEHPFDTVDFLHTRLQLLLVERSLDLLSADILYSICWWFSNFRCCNGKHILCPTGCKSLFKCTFLPHYAQLIPNMEFGWCSFSSIDFGIECIMYVLIVYWLACICGL